MHKTSLVSPAFQAVVLVMFLILQFDDSAVMKNSLPGKYCLPVIHLFFFLSFFFLFVACLPVACCLLPFSPYTLWLISTEHYKRHFHPLFEFLLFLFH
jgi:hypothetical protein